MIGMFLLIWFYIKVSNTCLLRKGWALSLISSTKISKKDIKMVLLMFRVSKSLIIFIKVSQNWWYFLLKVFKLRINRSTISEFNYWFSYLPTYNRWSLFKLKESKFCGLIAVPLKINRYELTARYYLMAYNSV